MNLDVVARTALKSTLEASAAYKALVVWPGAPTVYRTFGEYVSADVPMPYVTIEWYAGGLDNDAKTAASHSMWKIAAHTEEDEPLGRQISNEIYAALHGKLPSMGSITGYAGYNPILLKYPYFDVVVRQSRSILRTGGIYTIYLAEVRG
jgi:hypothetical protein